MLSHWLFTGVRRSVRSFGVVLRDGGNCLTRYLPLLLLLRFHNPVPTPRRCWPSPPPSSHRFSNPTSRSGTRNSDLQPTDSAGRTGSASGVTPRYTHKYIYGSSAALNPKTLGVQFSLACEASHTRIQNPGRANNALCLLRKS